MKHTRFALGLTVVMALLCRGAAIGQDAAPAAELTKESVTIKKRAAAREVRNYAVNFAVTEPAPAGVKDAQSLDARFSFKIRHSYGRREGDDMLPLEITLVSGEIVANGQKLEVTPGIYPKVTALMDREWKLSDLFGVASSRRTHGVPGLNYGNLIVLFDWQGGSEGRTIGEKWSTRLRLPSAEETYFFANTLKSVETIDGVRAAVVRQEITRSSNDPGAVPDPGMKAVAESAFSLENGRLLRSRVDCEVVAPADTTAGAKPASPGKPITVKIDIAPAK